MDKSAAVVYGGLMTMDERLERGDHQPPRQHCRECGSVLYTDEHLQCSSCESHLNHEEES